MADFAAWLGQGAAISEAERAAKAWRRIQDKPTSIVFRKPGGGTVGAQTVRIESDSMATPAESAAGLAPKRKAIVFGVRNHPSVTDTDMAEGYTFVLANDEYRCLDVILTLGEVQGIFEATG